MNNAEKIYNKIYLLVFLAVCVMLPSASAAKESPVSLYPRWQTKSIDSLMNMGERFNLRNSSDSALVCYTVVADRLRQNAPTKMEQQTLSRALTNMGYIYATFFYDYTRALELFHESLKTGSLCNYREDAAYIYLNMGGVYLSCNKMYGKNIFTAECWNYLEKALSEGLELKQYEVALVAFLNMGQLFFEDPRPENVKHAIDLLSKANIPQGTTFLLFTRRYADGLKAYINGDYNASISFFSDATTLTQPGTMHSARLELIALAAQSEAQEAAGQYNEAIETMNRLMELARETGSSDEETHGYRKLSELYKKTGDEDKAQESLFKYLQKKDSTIAGRDITMLSKFPLVNELESMKEQLAEERARKRRLLITACVAALFLAMSAFYTIALVRNRRKMKAYIKELYRKNMELVRAEQRERLLREQEAAERQQEKEAESVKYAASNLSQDECHKIQALILKALEDTDAITDPDFSLEKLSDDIGCQPRNVSQVINQSFGKNFRTLLNEYRIKEACIRLSDTEKYGSYTIEALAETVGFNSRSNFSVTFKKITGLSPAQFQKSAMTED